MSNQYSQTFLGDRLTCQPTYHSYQILLSISLSTLEVGVSPVLLTKSALAKKMWGL